MNIKILGPGCIRCQQLEVTVRETVKELGVDATVEDIKDIKKIREYPILATPGLVINEKLVLYGRIPSKSEITKIITNALANNET
jgi:small redox-active disulfide protein 2